MRLHRALGTIVTLGFIAALTAPAGASDARLKLEIGELGARAKEAVNLAVDKNTLDWAAKAIAEKGGNEAELRQLMTELDGIYVQVLEFDKETLPAWSEIQEATKGVLAKLDGPGWSPIISVTERGKDGDEVVRISLFTDAAGKPGGLAVFVLERSEVVLVNVVGPVKLEQLARIGAALGKPDMFGPLAGAKTEGKPAKASTGTAAKPAKPATEAKPATAKP
jgi:hypothetical protein